MQALTTQILSRSNMRVNKFVALASNLSRRKADEAIAAGRITINGRLPVQGANVLDSDTVMLDGQVIKPVPMTTIIFNKLPGYVVSRDGQGSSTIYDILPEEYQHLQSVGRLDKDSSGLLVLTNDGSLAQSLTHPSNRKTKVYHITIDKPLQPLHRQMISDHGIQLEDGPSRLQLERLHSGDDTAWVIRMHEGRNRQIRRTFAALYYTVITLHRTQFGPYALDKLPPGQWKLES